MESIVDSDLFLARMFFSSTVSFVPERANWREVLHLWLMFLSTISTKSYGRGRSEPAVSAIGYLSIDPPR